MCCNDMDRLAVLGNSIDRRCGNGRTSQQQVVALQASTGGAGPLPITPPLTEPISVVSTTIDTSNMSRPTVLLTFTSILVLPLGSSMTLNFRITRSSNNGTVGVGSTYTYATIVDAAGSDSFTFQFADVDVASGVYTYGVELSTNSAIAVVPGVTITNATLSALAVSNP